MKDLLFPHSVDFREKQTTKVGEFKKKRLNVELEYDVYRELKLMCYHRDISISDFTRTLVTDALKYKR